jgi:hypothetical protein
VGHLLLNTSTSWELICLKGEARCRIVEISTCALRKYLNRRRLKVWREPEKIGLRGRDRGGLDHGDLADLIAV